MVSSSAAKLREGREKDLWHLLRMGILFLFLLSAIVLASLRFQSVTVLGNTHYTSEEVVSKIFADPWDTNPVYCFMKERTKPHQQIPFIDKYVLHWNGFLSMEVIVYEKNVVGYVDYMSSHMYFDKDGIVVESVSEAIAGIPKIRGLSFGNIVLYKELPVGDRRVFNDIMNLTGSLSAYGISCDDIEYDAFLNATLQIGDLDVLLGQDRDMEMKLSVLHDILPKLQGMRGELDLSKYDEHASRESYIFKERSQGRAEDAGG